MNPHLHTIEHLYAHLHSSAQGLSQAEAMQRLQKFGANRLEKISGQTFAAKLLKEFTHFFALILWLAAGLAFVAEWKDPGQGMSTLGYAVLGVILVNGLFSFWQEYRAEKALDALRNLLPHYTTALRDGRAVQLPVAELVPGDVVLLAAGDDVPADCRLIEAFGVRVNTANLTGESKPMVREADHISEEQAVLRRDILHAGTSLISGEAKAMVYATGMHTEFGNIARLTQTAREPLSPLQIEIARLSRLVALFATLLGAVFFLIGQVIGLSLWENLVFAIGIIVANVPEGLLPTVTLSLAMATQRMAKKNALVRHLPAVETLGAASVICSDKTGTLTQNRMSIRQVFYSGALVEPDALVTAEPLYAVMRHCHDLRRVEQDGQSIWLGDPMEVALQEGTPSGGVIFPRLDEIPFDTERKRMSVICDTPQGHMLYCKGAPEIVLPLCSEMLLQGKRLPLDEASRASLLIAHEQMTERGLRVIALAYRSLPQHATNPESELIFAGLIGLLDPPREAVPEAVRRCHAAGIRVIMITGDHPHTASALAREIGLAQNPLAVTGDKLVTMSDTDLQLLLDEPGLLFARTGADQKMRIVQALQHKGEIVAVTGDGVNDAPSLKAADIGVAMGGRGTDVAREAASIVLLDDDFGSIVTTVRLGRRIYDNLRKAMSFILAVHVPIAGLALMPLLFGMPILFSPMHIAFLEMVIDPVCSLVFEAETEEEGVMKRPPRPPTEPLFSGPTILWSLVQGALVLVVTATIFALAPDYGLETDQVRGLTFASLVLGIVALIFVDRSLSSSLITAIRRPNRALAVVLPVVACLLAVTLFWQPARDLFGFAALDSVFLAVPPLAGLAVLLVLEALKPIWRRAVRVGAASHALSPGNVIRSQCVSR